MKKCLLALAALATSAMTLLAQPEIVTQPSDQVVTNGGTAVFSVAVSGTGPFTYQWQFKGTNFCVITTLAGTGTNSYFGDGGPATNAALNYPTGVSFDGNGNLFIADAYNARIRKVDTNGVVATVAGNGTYGYSGASGVATNVMLYYPYGVAADGAGSFFIADYGNNRIRGVDTNGFLTTVAGTGSNGYSGDGGPATNAMLGFPQYLAVDSAGNLFISDNNNNRIRKVDTNGLITTVAGTGTNGYSGDGGPATNAMVNYPMGVAVDRTGNLFISDYMNYRIRKVDTNGIITTVAGNGIPGRSGDGGMATNATIVNVGAVTVDCMGNLYLAEPGFNTVLKVDTNGIITTVAGGAASLNDPGDGGPASLAALRNPHGLTTDAAGNVHIADAGTNRIRRLATVSPPFLPTFTLPNITTNNLGNYSVVISDSSGSVTSTLATLNIPAYFILQPHSVTVPAGGSTNLSALAGSIGPLAYQWACNGTNIDWETNSILDFTNLQMSQSGAYSVAISNSFGGTISSNAILNVVPSLLTSQPANQSVAVGGTVSFSVTASGQGPFAYQWQFQGTNLPWAWTTNRSLALTNVQFSQAGAYSVVVSNLYGAVTSSNANLKVLSIIPWGSYVYGNTAISNVPAHLTNIILLAAGDTHGLALKTDGTVTAWGGNLFGQTNVPSGLTNVVSIAAGSMHSLALKSDGTVALWGKVPIASIGSSVPADATNIVALALGPGAQHGLFLRSDGSVEDWANSYYGLTNPPAMARNAVAVAAGAFHAVALRADGRVVAWGDSSRGQISIPASATNIVAIATGWYGNAALRADGTVLTWGSISSPSAGMTNVIDLACPMNSVFSTGDILVLRRNGTLVEYSGNVPSSVASNVTAIAAGSYNAFALMGSGPPVFSGLPVHRTVATGSRAYFRAVAAGTMPISYQWNCNGTNIIGATNSVLVLTNVQPVQAGSYYTLAASNAFGLFTNGAMFLNEVPLEFSIQPPILSAAVGATAKFTLAFTNGVGPFAWQWQCNNTNINGATNSSLSLTNVQLSQAGTYSLVAGNSYGSVTNTAVLTVLPMLFNAGSTNLAMTTNGFKFRLDSVYATQSVIIFASTDLVSWLPILTNAPATGSVLFLDSSATNLPQRFYRAVEQ